MKRLITTTLLLAAIAMLAPVATAQVHETPFLATFEAQPESLGYRWAFDIQSLIGEDARAVGIYRVYARAALLETQGFDTLDFAGATALYAPPDLREKLDLCVLLDVQEATVLGERQPVYEGLYTSCLRLTQDPEPRSEPASSPLSGVLDGRFGTQR